MAKNGRRVVLIQGAFEIVHWGHVKTLQFARDQGDYLVVALNSDDLIPRYKGRRPVQPWEYKKGLLEELRCVDEVVECKDFSPIELLKKFDVDVYIIGEEWYSGKCQEVLYMESKGGRVCVTPRFTGMSTTLIKEKLLEEAMAARGTSPGQTSASLSI